MAATPPQQCHSGVQKQRLHLMNAKAVRPRLQYKKSFAVGWQGLTFTGHRGENLIPDNGLSQWGHIQTTEALLNKGQFLLIWVTLALCSEQRLCDFYLRLWCKIRRIVNRFHWCPALYFFSFFFFLASFPHSLIYVMVQWHPKKKKKKKGWEKKRKGCRTSERWHFNSCWGDKNNTTIDGAVWTHLEIMPGARVGGGSVPSQKQNDSK